MKKHKTARVGSSFDSFLAEEGILGEAEARAIKRVIAWQLDRAMHKHKMTKAVLAQTMQTSRSELNRLLDPDNVSLTLRNMTKVAAALGQRVHVKLVPARRPRRGASVRVAARAEA